MKKTWMKWVLLLVIVLFAGRGVFFATPKYLKMQTVFPKVAAGNSSFLHVSPA